MRRRIRVLLGLVTAALAAALFAYWYWTNDEHLRSLIEAQLQEYWPDCHVQLRRARWSNQNQVELFGLRVRQTLSSGSLEVIDLPEAVLTFEGSPFRSPIQKVQLRHPRLRAIQSPDGQWNLQEFLPEPLKQIHLPEIVVHRGVLEVTWFHHPDTNEAPRATAMRSARSAGKRTKAMTLRDVNGQLRPEGENTYRIETQIAHSNQFGRARLSGQFNRRDHRWDIQGRIDQLQVAPELLIPIEKWLHTPSTDFASDKPPSPDEIAHREFFSVLESFRGECQIEFQLRQEAAQAPVVGEYRVQLAGGRVDDPRLPFPLNNVQATLQYHNGSLELERFTAQNGAAQFSATGRWNRSSSDSVDNSPRASAQIEVTHLELDGRIERWLPSYWRRLWQRLQPAGRINLHIQLALQADDWQWNGRLECVDASFAYDRFPYRLEHVTGTVVRQPDNKLALKLQGSAHNGSVKLNGAFDDPGPHSTGQLHILAEGVTIDRQLLQALRPSIQTTVEAFHPEGSISVHWQVQRTKPGERYENSADITLQDCMIRWEEFPYPLRQVTGTLRLRENQWELIHLQGQNDMGRVTANGRLTLPPARSELELTLEGKNVSLEPELRAALPEPWQQAWDCIAPRGQCHLQIHLARHDNGPIQVTSAQLWPQNATIRLRHFPYRLERVQGQITGAGSSWQLDRIEGWHGPTRVRLSGQVRVEEPGGTLQLDELIADGVTIDADLLAALPPALASALREINPTGQPISLRRAAEQDAGRPAFRCQWGRDPADFQAQWNLAIHLAGTSLNPQWQLAHLYGSMAIAGQYDSGTLHCDGTIDLDSATFHGLQVTQVKGPIRLRNSKLTLGAWPPQSSSAAQINGRMLGGRVIANADIQFRPELRYGLQLYVRNADLRQYALEYLPGRQRLSGWLNAVVNVKGTKARGTAGQGHLSAHHADLYELPLVFSALNVLSLKVPDAPIFYEGTVDWRVERSRIAVEQLTLVSDAMTLYGHGEMSQLSADARLNLTMYPIVADNGIRIPALRELFRQASKQLVAIEVTGSLSEPRARIRYVPSVDAALKEVLSRGRAGTEMGEQALDRLLRLAPP